MSKVSAGKYIGAKVKLLRDMRTQGGITFRAGVVMRCSDSTSAGLSLWCKVRGWHYGIRNVSKQDVVVIEWPKKDEES